MNESMVIGAAGLEIIKECEGLQTKAYICPAGILTIGYGHTGKDVTKDLVITETQAEDLLRQDVKNAEKTVRTYVKVQLTQGQFDALVSFVFNLGAGNFKSSTLLKKLNANDIAGAADEFLRWNKSGGKVLPGLTKRRERERACFLS